MNSRRKPRVVYWFNQPTPYVVSRFNAIADSGAVDFEAWFSEERQSDRSWDVDASSWRFPARYIPARPFFGVSLHIPLPELREYPPDMFVCEYDRVNLAAGVAAARFAAHRVALRSLPNFDAWSRRTWWREGAKHLLFRSVDAAKVPGPGGAALSERYGLPPELAHVVTQSVSVAHYARALEMPAHIRESRRASMALHGCVFVYVGRIWSGKGLDDLFTAYRQLAKGERREDISLLVIGDGGDEEHYRTVARDLPHVAFVGFIQPNDMPEWYALGDCLVFPTRGDPNGLVVEEAFAAGLPVICSDAAGDIDRRLPSGEVGFVFPAGDVEALSDCMRRICGSETLRKRMGSTATGLVASMTDAQYAQGFQEFVAATLARSRRTGPTAAAVSSIGLGLLLGARLLKWRAAGLVSDQSDPPATPADESPSLRPTRRADPLPGTGLMQSKSEWSARTKALADSLADLILAHLPRGAVLGLDVGCQDGTTTDEILRRTGLDWVGIDPAIRQDATSQGGAKLQPGRADDIPYPADYFDCAVLANVFEHLRPEARSASLAEMCRVLKPGGIIVGQIPNPYFPIESHSRLPFMGWLPQRVQHKYWSLSRVPWEHDFYVVTLRHVRVAASCAGLDVELERPFNYPLEAIPEQVRSVAKVLGPILHRYPWSWQFVLRRPE